MVSEETPLGRLDKVEAIAFTERDGRKYVAVMGIDDRNREGHIILDFDNGDLIYEHSFWFFGAYLMENQTHHEYERKLSALNSETKELYFGANGINRILKSDLEEQVSSRKKDAA